MKQRTTQHNKATTSHDKSIFMKEFKKLEQEFSHEEIAESYIFPGSSSKEEKEKALELFKEHRDKKRAKETSEERLSLQILQLKFLIEDYIQDTQYNSKFKFGYFLREYISSLELKNKDFAEDIGIKPVELSHYLSNRRKPNEELMIRLEIHSNNNIPAVYWFKILEKEYEHDIVTDMQIRKQEEKNVKNKLEFSL